MKNALANKAIEGMVVMFTLGMVALVGIAFTVNIAVVYTVSGVVATALTVWTTYRIVRVMADESQRADRRGTIFHWQPNDPRRVWHQVSEQKIRIGDLSFTYAEALRVMDDIWQLLPDDERAVFNDEPASVDA